MIVVRFGGSTCRRAHRASRVSFRAMIRHLRPLVLASLSLVACGGDNAADAGADGGADATTQDGSTQDGGADATTQDAGQDSSSDATTQQDVVTDAPSDAAGDGGLASLCTSTGGTVSSGLCCTQTTDFPSTCTTGPCGCSPQNSHQVQICQCPKNKCFSSPQGCH